MGGKTKKEVGVVVHKSGVQFRVWAPFAESVAITGTFNEFQETELEKEDDGYWFVLIKNAAPGHEYKYVIKNGDKVLRKNDPRATQMTSWAGNSVVPTPSFDWSDDKFVAAPIEEQIIYELHVGSFYRPDTATMGTFSDVCEKLDHLEKIGVNMIEVLPISTMDMDRGWGYSPDYIYAIESMYGGRYGFMKFVKEAHARGIGVIVDVVYNHLSGDEHLDLWQFDGWSENGRGGIYFFNDERGDTPWGSRPDYARAEVMQYLLDNVKMWMHDCNVDGLRVDSTIYIRNTKGYNNDPSTDIPEGWKLLQNINHVAKKIKPNALMIGEDVADNEYITKPIEVGGAGFTTQWELNFPHSVREALKTTNPDELNITEILGELGKQYNGDVFQKVIYTDSHDTAANGSARTNEVISPGKSDSLFARKQSIIAATLLLTAPGIPMLLQGQEFLEGGSFSDWRALNWELAERNRGIVDAYSHLAVLRQNKTKLSAGLTGRGMNLIHTDDYNKVIAYHRWKDGGPKDDTVVVINFSDRKLDNYSMSLPRNGEWKIRFNSTLKIYGTELENEDIAPVHAVNGGVSISLPPSCALVLTQDN